MPNVLPKHGKRVATHPRHLTTRIARWLEAEMADRDLSQLELATRLHGRISQGYVNGILRAGRLPDDGKVRLLAQLFQTPADDVLTLIYLDRIARLLENAPKDTRAMFSRVLAG